MALAAELIPGFKYRILSGIFSDEIVTIINNTPFPDSDEQGRQRKITVAGPDGRSMYILPRLLDRTPLGVDTEQAPGITIHSAPIVSAPIPVATPSLSPEVVQTGTAPNGRPTYTIVPITDPMDPRLDHLRPSRAKVRRYISREMSNGMTDIDWALSFTSDAYRERNQGWPVALAFNGDTQSGKTFFIEVLAVAWAERLGLPKPMPIFTLSGSAGVTDYDLFGQVTSFTDASGFEMLVFLPGLVDLAARVGGILYLDEMNAMQERVTSSLHPVIDHRHAFVNRNKPVWRDGQFMPDVVVASQDLWVLASFNEGYKGMGDMNEAFKGRFRHVLWGYDDAVERKLIKSDAIRLLGSRLRLARQAKRSMTPCGTGMLQNMETDVTVFGVAIAVDMFIANFKQHERADVVSIIEDGSIQVLLNEELRQALVNAKP